MTASTSYPLKGLTDEESWSLLKNIAFGDDSKGVNQNLESMGKEIARKCKGVPLAAKTLGGLLRGQNEESEWENVLRGDFWKLCEEQISIIPILKLSYQNLSPEMRQCFAYCSLYPKDSIISKDELIQLWMAQGYLICSTEKQHMEDVGNQFVKMFLMNSYFQDAEIDKYGEIKSFKMHDLMHDLAMLVAGNDCCYLDSKVEKVEGSPMHISLESDEAIHLLNSLDKNRLGRLRTLILRDIKYFRCYKENKEDLSAANFKYLRVIRIWSTSFCNLLDSIGNLEHLRYLHIVDAYYLRGMPVGLGKLCSLQFLLNFVAGDGTLNELKDLNLRGKLSISNLSYVRDVALESQDVNLKEKQFLQSLTLRWWDIYIGDNDSLQLLENLQPHPNLKQLVVWCYPGVLFPNWLSLLTNVVHITLCKFHNCRCLPPLEHLPFLRSLDIEDLHKLEYIYLHEDGFAVTFPSLESLKLRGCPNLRGWHRRVDNINNDSTNSHDLSLPLSFPHLSILNVSGCRKFTCMPTFPNVKELYLGWGSVVEPLIATLNTTASPCSADSSSSAPLSMLKQLTICDPMNLPKGWMQNLTSLESLQIGWCESETLEEYETWFKDDTNCLPSLRQITLYSCIRLKALPDWICNLSSLQHIKISHCLNLASLSEGMSRLTNLKIFEVESCFLLEEECQKETSAVSRQIAHIPRIILPRDQWFFCV